MRIDGMKKGKSREIISLADAEEVLNRHRVNYHCFTLRQMFDVSQEILDKTGETVDTLVVNIVGD